MRQLMSVLLIAAFLGTAPVLVGCDRTVSDKEQVKVKDDGTTVKDKEQVKEKPNGDVVKEESHTVNH